MAQVPYQGGVPQVSPDATPPNDYLRAEARPEEFGGLIAQGLEKAGAGATDLNKFWNHIQANDASNNAEKEASALADQISNLQGRDRLAAQDDAYKQLDAIRDKYKGQLASPESQFLFEQQTTPYFNRYIRGQLNTRFTEAGTQVADEVAQNSYLGAQNMAADAGSRGDWKYVGPTYMRAYQSQYNLDQHRGMENDPDAATARAAKAGLVWKSAIEARAAVDPADAYSKLQDPAVKSALGDAWAPLVDRIKSAAMNASGRSANSVAAADIAAGWRPGMPVKGVPTYGQSSVAGAAPATPTSPAIHGDYGPTFTQYNRDLNNGDVASALRLSEGLKTVPYWDESPGHPELSHWAIGYGNHYVTRPDGKLEEVTPFTRITPEDAERSLQTQAVTAARNIQTTLGPERWGSMTAGQKSALVSVYYNYGHLPDDIAKAAMSGDPAALSSAIASHAGDNNGVNAKRRLAEAGAVMGTFGLSGPVHPQTYSIGARPEGEDQETPASPETGAMVQPAAYEAPPAPPAPTDTGGMPSASDADQMVAAADRARALRLQYLAQMDLDPVARQKAEDDADRDYKIAILGIEATKSEQQHAYTAATDKYLSALKTQNPQQVYQAIESDATLDEQHKELLQEIVEKRTGQPNQRSYGPGYVDTLKRILLPERDPDRIYSTRQVLELERDGQLSKAGSDDLLRSLGLLQKSEDEQGLQTTRAGLVEELQTKMSAGLDAAGKERNQRGLELFRTSGISALNEQWNAWRELRREGKGDPQFPLTDPKKFDAFVESIYPRKQRDADLHASMNGDVTAPPGVDRDRWALTLDNAPTFQNGQQPPRDLWTKALTNLVANPLSYGPRFDAAMGPGMAKAALGQLGIAYTPAAAKPENVGATPTATTKAPEQFQAVDERVKGNIMGALTWGPEGIAKLGHWLADHDASQMTPEQRKFWFGG